MSNVKGLSVVHACAGQPIVALWWRNDGSCERIEISSHYALQLGADFILAAKRNLITEPADPGD